MEKMFMLHSSREMEVFAGKIAASAAPPLVIALTGALGSGKTTFARGFIRALGWQGKVKSPTYTLMNEYSIRGIDIFHFDFYRFSDVIEFETMGAKDCFHQNSICLIEWPERVTAILPLVHAYIHFFYRDDGRTVKIQLHDSRIMLPDDLSI